MPAFDVAILGKVYHIDIPDPGATPLQVIVDGEPFEIGIIGTEVSAAPAKLAPPPHPAPEPAPLPQPPHVAVARPAVPAGGNGGNTVTAPMPGTILSVDVAVGQSTDTGQVLCVLEAMKMKNPIRATHPGTVAEICVQPGQTVPYGEVLIRLA